MNINRGPEDWVFLVKTGGSWTDCKAATPVEATDTNFFGSYLESGTFYLVRFFLKIDTGIYGADRLEAFTDKSIQLNLYCNYDSGGDWYDNIITDGYTYDWSEEAVWDDQTGGYLTTGATRLQQNWGPYFSDGYYDFSTTSGNPIFNDDGYTYFEFCLRNETGYYSTPTEGNYNTCMKIDPSQSNYMLTTSGTGTKIYYITAPIGKTVGTVGVGPLTTNAYKYTGKYSN